MAEANGFDPDAAVRIAREEARRLTAPPSGSLHIRPGEPDHGA